MSRKKCNDFGHFMYVGPGCAILNETQWCFPDRREEKNMKIGMEELEDLRDGLERLMEFIRGMEQGELPYFYRYFSTMKSNIEMFFCIGCEDIADFFPVLERDWKASHTMFIGVQDYDLRKEHPEADPMLCLYFARLLAEVGKYFERGKAEFVREGSSAV